MLHWTAYLNECWTAFTINCDIITIALYTDAVNFYTRLLVLFIRSCEYQENAWFLWQSYNILINIYSTFFLTLLLTSYQCQISFFAFILNKTNYKIFVHYIDVTWSAKRGLIAFSVACAYCECGIFLKTDIYTLNIA